MNPNIIYDEVNYIDDVLLEDYNYCDLISVVDNDNRKCNISYSFYIGEELINDVEEFKRLLLLGSDCCIKFHVYDYSLNYSCATLKVFIKDTTCPSIKVNIIDNNVYKELNSIEYEVNDNLCSELEISVLLDGKQYNNEKILEGKHTLYISAKDTSGNFSEYKCSFVVSNKSFIGNLIEGNIKLKSSVVVCVVLISITIIGILKFRNSYMLKKNSKES